MRAIVDLTTVDLFDTTELDAEFNAAKEQVNGNSQEAGLEDQGPGEEDSDQG
jgi:hypothetical protein